MLADGSFDNITKKERLQLSRDRDKMEKVLGGIAQLGRVPAALFIIDIGHEHIAMAEAKRLGITTFGMVDTNCDPNKVDFPVPSNDDATKSIAIITNYITAAIAEGLAERQAEKSDEGEDGDDSGENALKFSVDEEGDADGGRRNKPGAPKRRVPAAGGGGRRPAQKK
jgi:small subunit ribosomal protein S2